MRGGGLGSQLGPGSGQSAPWLFGVRRCPSGGLWPDDVGLEWFSGNWRIAVITTVGGLIVGLIHVIDKQAREVNVFAALASGTIDRRALPGAIAGALVSLVDGFSLGPEVPTG